MATLKYIAGADLMTVTLASAYTAADGVMHLTSGHGARLPNTGDFWLRTTTGTYRSFKVTARSTDDLSVTPAQDGTSDGNLATGAELKWVLGATALDQIKQDLLPDILSLGKPSGTCENSVGKQVSTTAATPLTLLTYSGGPGYVSDIWIALDPPSGDDGTTLTITVDGATLYSGRYDLFFGTLYFRGGWGPGRFGNAFLQDRGGQGSFIPIPFSSSIVVTVTTPGNSQIWWNVSYQTAVANTWNRTRELSVASGYLQQYTQDQVATLVNLTGLSPGRLLGIYMMVDSFTSPGASPQTSPLEGAVKIYLDGSLAFTSSGTEDYFRMAGFFVGASPGDNAGPFVSLACKNSDHWGAMRFHIPDPKRFENALKVTWNAGNSAISTFTGSVSLSWVVWYYTEG